MGTVLTRTTRENFTNRPCTIRVTTTRRTIVLSAFDSLRMLHCFAAIGGALRTVRKAAAGFALADLGRTGAADAEYSEASSSATTQNGFIAFTSKS